MIVFKTFLKVLNKCKSVIILYTAILVFFGAFNMTSSDNNMSFTPTKPDVLVINNDESVGITKDLVKYISDNSNIKDIKDEGDNVNDALFYRELNYIIYIPKNFRNDFLSGKNPKVEVKSTGDYNSSLASMTLERYLNVANSYVSLYDNEDELIKKINETIDANVDVSITSKLDSSSLEKATFYFNFTNYSFLAGAIYVICLILTSFKSEMINKRTIVSSTNYKKFNRDLLISNALFAFVLWFFYVILGFILLGDIMFSKYAIVYVINTFIFSMCALSIAFLIGNLVSNKNAINGIVNVVALGSSFLCGAFVPMEWLPDSVLKIAHVLPSYYFIKSNEILKSVEVFSLENLKPIIINMSIMIMFSVLFIIITNYVSKRKRVY